MLSVEQYKEILSVAIRAIHAAQLERYIRTGQNVYYDEYHRSPKFYSAVYIAACDSAILNINKLYNPDADAITLYSVMHDIKPTSNAQQYKATQDMRAFIKSHKGDIDAIRKIRNACAGHLSKQKTSETVRKDVVEEMAEYAYDYIKNMCCLQHGIVVHDVLPCNDIELTWKLLKEVQNGKT